MPETPAVELTIGRGPLSEEELAGIALTYGKVDPRYQSLHFCRVLFNENPFGYSFHAFVRDGEKVVGHNAVIPIRVRTRGRLVTSGKGEALYLDPDYRAAMVETEKGPIPAGIALIARLENHTLVQEMELIHNITTRDVGSIRLRTGFKLIHLSRRQWHFLITPHRFPLLAQSKHRLAAGYVLSALQRCLRRLLGLALRLASAPAVEVNPPGHLEEILAALAAADEKPRPTWSVARDPETLRWQLRLDRFEVLVPRGSPQHFAVLTKGLSRELICWNLPAGAWRTGLALWHEALARSERDRAAIVSLDHRLRRSSACLRWGGWMTALFPRAFPASLYIKSSDPYYRDPENIAFDRLFNLT